MMEDPGELEGRRERGKKTLRRRKRNRTGNLVGTASFSLGTIPSHKGITCE
jgi:hypothetical protein